MAVELREKVGLIFDRIFCRGEETDAVKEFFLGVMASSYAVVVLTPSVFKGTELDEFVAHNVGMWCEASLDCFDCVGDNTFPIFFVEVDDLHATAVFLSEPSNYLNIFLGGAIDVAIFLFFAYADIVDVGVVALLLEEMNDHRAVDST